MTRATRVGLAASIVLLVTSELAGAGGKTISSPAIYGGGDANLAFCAVRNVGTKATTPEVRIFDESGTTLDASQTCNGAPLPAGTSCLLEPGGILVLRANIAQGFAYACSATGKVRSLRGSLLLGCCQMSAPSTSYRSSELR